MMAENRQKKLFFAGGILFYLTFLLIYINDSYPLVGHDYRYFLPRIVDTYIHYKNNGFTIQWFTPSFGGGLPAYHNPQQIQFSLTQLLLNIFNPWWAVMLTAVIYTSIGYLAWYRFSRDVIGFTWMTSVLGGIFFVGNGFILQHLASGHLGFFVFPLCALFFYVLFLQKWKLWHRGILLGLILSFNIHSAGFYIIIILALSFLMLVPLVYLFQPNWRDLQGMVRSLGIGILITLLLSGGKIYAVLGFMQNFPRVITHEYYASFIQSLVGFLTQFVGVPIFTIPFRILGKDPTVVGQTMTALIGGSEFGIWEMDVSISPVLIYILVVQLMKLPHIIKEGKAKRFSVLRKDLVTAILSMALGVWLAFEFTSARGVIFRQIRTLPILSSLYNNIRYAVSFLMPLIIVGGDYLDQKFSNAQPHKISKTFLFFFVGTLLSLCIYFLLPNELQSRNFNVSQTLADYKNARTEAPFYVSDVMEVTDSMVFSSHATSLYLYEAIFGYDLEEFSTRLEPGSIYQEEDGYYNLTNPRSLVYDTDELFVRFSLDQREMMEDFVHYRQPDWDIPKTQHLLNTISGGTFILMAGYGAYYLIWGRRKEREELG